jgi:hypothetical protein
MNRLLRAGLALVFAVISCATSLEAGSNTTYAFLRNDVSSRAAALAGSFVSIMDDPNALFYNPASLSTLSQPSGSLGFFKHLLDVNAGYISYSQSIGDIGAFGAGVVYVNYGTFDERDDLGNTIGTFNANDLAFVAGYSNLLDVNLHYGINVKVIYSSIGGYSSTGIAGDVGILYNIPDSRVALGASIRNIGAQISSYLGTREDLPLDVVIGGSVTPQGLPLLLNINFHRINEEGSFTERFRAFTVGGEFTLSQSFQLRFGYDNEKRKDLKVGTSPGLAGFSAGIGLVISDYKLDYALSSLGKIGELHRISIGTTF